MTKKRAVKLIALFVMTAAIYLFLQWFLIRTSPTTEYHIKNFFKEPDNSMDVGFVGASEMYADYSPPLAYKKYGFTGYNFCFEGAPGQLYNAMIDVYLDHQSPQLMVIEINGFLYKEWYAERDVNYQKFIDNLPFSLRKLQIIHDYVDEDDRINYYVPMVSYHSNWKGPVFQSGRALALFKNSFSDYSMTKSLGTRSTTESQRAVLRRYKKKDQITDWGLEELRKTVAYCKEKGIEKILFLRAPHKAPMPKKTVKQIREIIEGAGYDFLNCERKISEEIGIDESTDYYNDDHLNVLGCEKFTDYLGNYIMTNYDITTDHSEKIDKEWEECADYTQKVFDEIKPLTFENEDELYYEMNVDRLVKKED